MTDATDFVTGLGRVQNQDEGEIVGEANTISFHLFVYPLHGHTVEVGEVRMEDDPLTAQDQD